MGLLSSPGALAALATLKGITGAAVSEQERRRAIEQKERDRAQAFQDSLSMMSAKQKMDLATKEAQDQITYNTHVKTGEWDRQNPTIVDTAQANYYNAQARGEKTAEQLQAEAAAKIQQKVREDIDQITRTAYEQAKTDPKAALSYLSNYKHEELQRVRQQIQEYAKVKEKEARTQQGYENVEKLFREGRLDAEHLENYAKGVGVLDDPRVAQIILAKRAEEGTYTPPSPAATAAGTGQEAGRPEMDPALQAEILGLNKAAPGAAPLPAGPAPGASMFQQSTPMDSQSGAPAAPASAPTPGASMLQPSAPLSIQSMPGGMDAATQVQLAQRPSADMSVPYPSRVPAPTAPAPAAAGVTPAPAAPSVSGPAASFEPYVQEAAAKYNIPAAYIRAVIDTESSGDPRAFSTAGARGLMQLKAGAQADTGTMDPYDPRQNIMGGTAYLRMQLDRFGGNMAKALMAYRVGAQPVLGGAPPPEARAYAAQIMQKASQGGDAAPSGQGEVGLDASAITPADIVRAKAEYPQLRNMEDDQVRTYLLQFLVR